MKELRVGIVGAGMMGINHADAIARLPYGSVRAIADPNPAALDRAAELLGAVEKYTDYREMVEKAQLGVLHNCSPNHMHHEVNEYALLHGLHVYCEKPLDDSVGGAQALVALAQERGLAAGVNYNYRNFATVQDMRRKIAAGDTGRILLVHGHYLQDWLMKEDDYNWRLEPGKGGASRALADIGSHWFDLIQTVTGKKIIRVFANPFCSFPSRVKVPGDESTRFKVETEDGAMVIFLLDDGVQGSLLISQVSGGYKNDIFMSVDCENYSMRWEQESPDRIVFGDRDSGEIMKQMSPGYINGYSSTPEGHVEGWPAALRNGISLFYRSIAAGNVGQDDQPYATFKDGAAVMRIVDACLKSGKCGAWTDVD